MKPDRVAFTEKRVADLKPPAAGRRYAYDARTAGLAVCLTSAGARTYYIYRKVNGRPVRLRLGTTSELTLDMARKTTVEIVGGMIKGIDPQAAKRAKRQEPKLRQLWAVWEIHAKAHKRAAGYVEDCRKWTKILEPWAGDRRLSAITKRDVITLHAKLGTENGPYLANRTINLLGAMFAKADDLGFSGPNPTKGVQRFPEEKRDRFLHGDELPRLFEALKQAPPLIQDFILVCLLCGARRSNVQAMRWDCIDFVTRLWRIPPDQSKSKVVVVVPLSLPVVAILERRREAVNGSPWVFPAPRAIGKTGHLVEPKRSWHALLKAAGLWDATKGPLDKKTGIPKGAPTLHLHDLRRSLGSWMASGNVSMTIVAKALGHSELRSTAVYARLAVDPVAAAVEEAGNAMLAAGNGSTASGNGEQNRPTLITTPT
jgi:integrase